MTRHPTARRVHREDSAPDDVFVAGVLETSAWAKQHQRSLIIAGITLAVAIAALVLWLNHRSSLRERAAVELSQVRAGVMAGNPELAIRDLEQFLATYGGTPSGAEARLMLGRAYLDVGRTQDAIDIVRPTARKVGTDMGANATFLLAAAHEAAREPHRAEEAYLRVGNSGRFLFQRQEALDHAARIRLQRGDIAGAIQLYERLISMTPEADQDRQIFELRLGEARALAVSSRPAAGEGAVDPAVDAADPDAAAHGAAPQPVPPEGQPEGN
jgi:predicted negative regulator of RcsB-dependent stress response